MKRNQLILSIVAAALLSAGITAFAVTKAVTAKQSTKVEFVTTAGAGTHFTSWDQDNYPDLTYAAENAVQAVVNIENIQMVGGRMSSQSYYNPFFEFFGFPGEFEQQEPQNPREMPVSGGSGVIITGDGYIVTNNHVIEEATKLRVTLNDNRTFEAEVIGTDPTTDVALLKIDATDLPTLPFGNSDALRLGEWVLAIGSPYELQSTITAGIVSAKARNLNVIPSEYSLESFIQTDAAVNPGNSGGALVNVRGELVGINTVIKSPTGSFTGYSFAVPSAIVQKVVVDLREFGMVQRALLGIRYQQINNGKVYNSENELIDIDDQRGLYVSEVISGGAAEAAGLKAGDIITEMNGVKMEATANMIEEIARHRPNDKVKISAKRDGQLKQFDVVLRNTAGKAELLSRDYVAPKAMLGGTFSEINSRTARQYNIEGGLAVRSVAEDGVLRKAGIRVGSIITGINDVTIKSESDLSKVDGKITSIDIIEPNSGRAMRYVLPD